MVRETIAVDLDEVLGQFIPQLCKYYNANVQKFPFTTTKSLTADAFFSYQFCRVWGGTDSDSLDIVEGFFADETFTGGLPLVPGAVDGIRALKDAGYELVVVTSRQHIIENLTRTWVGEHFPGLFASVSFGNHWGRDGRKVSKPELCAAVGATVLIDDAVGYSESCAAAGMRALLFGDYAWNQTTPTFDAVHPRVQRVKGWDEVLRELL